MIMIKKIAVRWPILLLLAVAVADGGMFSYLRFIYSPGWPSDSIAHVLNARMMVDSLTPGFSQLGFWPPILHILLIPAIYFDVLYKSDVAGFITLFPFLYASAYYLFRIIEILTERRAYSWLAVTVYLLNPYILYFSSAAMTEILFIAAFLAMMYFWLRWMKGGGDMWAFLSACMVSLAFLSRYEGIVLMPFVPPFFFLSSLHRGSGIKQSIALTLLCLMLASIGIAWVLLYGLYYGGDPFAFLNIGIRSSAETVLFENLDKFTVDPDRVARSWKIVLAAARHLMGGGFWTLGLCLYGVSLVLCRNKVRAVTLGMISVPFLSIFLLMALKRANVVVPDVEMPVDRGDAFSNTRYLLPAVILPVIGSTLAVASLNRGRITRFIRECVILIMIGLSVWNVFDVLYIKKLQVIRKDISRTSPAWNLSGDDRIIEKFYDYGFILAIRHYSEVGIARGNVPISAYIHEGTYQHIRQAVNEPWLFARIVILPRKAVGPEVSKLREVSQTEAFKWYYDEIHSDNGKIMYQLNENRLRNAAKSLGYQIEKIPSLRQSFEAWVPGNFYESLHSPAAFR